MLPDVLRAKVLHMCRLYLVFLDFSKIQNTIKPQQLFLSESSIHAVWHLFVLCYAKAATE